MKMSIYASDMGVQWLLKAVEPEEKAVRKEKELNRSARLNGVSHRYMFLMDMTIRNLPLSTNEWGAIMDANNGTSFIWPEHWSYTAIWANVADLGGLGEKWEIDEGALLEKLRGMTLLEYTAIQEVIDRFWSQDRSGTIEEAISAALGRVAAE